MIEYSEKILLDGVAKNHRFSRFPLIRNIGMVDIYQQSIIDEFNRQQYPKYYGEPTGLIEVPESWLPGQVPRMRIIDGLLLDGKRTAIECKISRADFKKDTWEKRRHWFRYSNKFVYLTPPGLVDVSEVPNDCGLWEFDGLNIHIAKKAKIRKEVPEWPEDFTNRLIWRLSKAEDRLRK